jgi:hypothetical protein
VTKRFLKRTNHLDEANIQTTHIARVVCSFLASVVPVTIVRAFMLTGICLVRDSYCVLCTIRPDQDSRRLIPLAPIRTEVDDRTWMIRMREKGKPTWKNVRNYSMTGIPLRLTAVTQQYIALFCPLYQEALRASILWGKVDYRSVTGFLDTDIFSGQTVDRNEWEFTTYRQR